MAYTTVPKSSFYFTPTLYVGNGSTKTVTGVPFEPDMTWLKNRSGATDNEIYDKVRGVGYRIYPNTSAGQDDLGSQGLSAWTSDGFTVGNNGAINGNGNNLVSWNWKANGQGSSNTDGTINSTYTSANTTSGCSIVKYTGTGSNASIGHGLGVKPAMIMIKNLETNGEDWAIYHKSLGGYQYYLKLNSTSAVSNNTNRFYAEPTTSVVNIGSVNETNQSGVEFIAYVFAEKTGFSKFGTFTASNPCFVYTGFKPAFVMLKRYSATGNWSILDNKRANSFNPQDPLYANATDAEQTSDDYDLVSNGFVIRNASGGGGGDSGSMLYMAFAEEPLVSSNGVAATAR